MTRNGDYAEHFFLHSNLQLALADVNKILTFELFSKILHAKLGVLRV